MSKFLYFIFICLTVNNNYWIFGSIPTQVLAIPLAVYFIHAGQSKYIIIYLFSIIASVQLLNGFDDFIKHILIFFVNLIFGLSLFRKKNEIIFLHSILILSLFFIFLPNEILKHPKWFFEYGFIFRASLFTQNANELMLIYLMPAIISTLRNRNNFVFYWCGLGILLTGSRVGLGCFISLYLLQLPRRSKIEIAFFCIIVIACIIQFSDELYSIIEFKASDILTNNRWSHSASFISEFNASIYKDGVMPNLGNAHNTFLALGSRFGVLGILFSFVLLIIAMYVIISLCIRSEIHFLLVTLIATLPLLFYDLTLSPYFGFWVGMLILQGGDRSCIRA